MTITSLAEHATRTSDSRFIVSGSAGHIPVDVLVEGRAAERTARHILQRLLHLLPESQVLHDEALLSASRVLDDLVAGIARESIPFLSVSVGRPLAPNSGSRSGVTVADPVNECDYGSVMPSVVIVASGKNIVGVATAVSTPRGPDSLIAATVSSAQTGLSTVLARHVLVLGPSSAEPLLRMSEASGIAIAASGAYLAL